MLRYIHIPKDWTANQAWSVLELIYQLEELIWDTHEAKLIHLLGPDDDPSDFFDDVVDPDEDDIPF